jgi:hypothetical protein
LAFLNIDKIMCGDRRPHQLQVAFPQETKDRGKGVLIVLAKLANWTGKCYVREHDL